MRRRQCWRSKGLCIILWEGEVAVPHDIGHHVDIVDLPKEFSPALIHEVYQEIRELKDEKGEPYALGHATGPDTNMVLLNNNDRATIDPAEFVRLIEENSAGGMMSGPIFFTPSALR
jgi:hypothetical protein